MTHLYYVRHSADVWHIQIVKATRFEESISESVHLDFLANPDVANGLVSALNRS